MKRIMLYISIYLFRRGLFLVKILLKRLRYLMQPVVPG